MSTIHIWGASDDLIEVDGDIREEFPAYLDAGEFRILAVSDGTLVKCRYDENGIWRFDILSPGTASASKVDGDVVRDTCDQLTLTGDIRWVVVRESVAIAAKKA